jgi:hypothetical protein
MCFHCETKTKRNSDSTQLTKDATPLMHAQVDDGLLRHFYVFFFRFVSALFQKKRSSSAQKVLSSQTRSMLWIFKLAC